MSIEWEALGDLLASTTDVPVNEVARVVTVAGRVLGAESARILVADYGLVTLRVLGADGPVGDPIPIAGTMAGRAFARGEVVRSGAEGSIWVPLAEGSERLGVLELVHPTWSDSVEELLGPVVRVLVLVLVSKRRYTDAIVRSRRTEPLALAAEIQWDLLPPLTYTTDRASISGILEPAYSIGGDSFDYAVNLDRLEFGIIDAVGHGMAAVLMSVVAVNSLRNSRREGDDLRAAYSAAGSALATHFGNSAFVTGQIGSLALGTGELTWLNAGHPQPLLVRDGIFSGELRCRPSLPMGLGGTVTRVAVEPLQPGDRVLFFTDGVVESRSPGGAEFGVERLADHFLRATSDGVRSAETVRRLAADVVEYNGASLNDDATLLLVDYHGAHGPAG